MFQLQRAVIRPLYKDKDKDLFLYRGLMMALCNWNMLPWWYVCILTIKWRVRLNDSRIYNHIYQLDAVVCVAADRHRRLQTATRAGRVLHKLQKERFADECTCTPLPWLLLALRT